MILNVKLSIHLYRNEHQYFTLEHMSFTYFFYLYVYVYVSITFVLTAISVFLLFLPFTYVFIYLLLFLLFLANMKIMFIILNSFSSLFCYNVDGCILMMWYIHNINIF